MSAGRVREALIDWVAEVLSEEGAPEDAIDVVRWRINRLSDADTMWVGIQLLNDLNKAIERRKGEAP